MHEILNVEIISEIYYQEISERKHIIRFVIHERRDADEFHSKLVNSTQRE